VTNHTITKLLSAPIHYVCSIDEKSTTVLTVYSTLMFTSSPWIGTCLGAVVEKLDLHVKWCKSRDRFHVANNGTACER
jgi:hypothetical protein